MDTVTSPGGPDAGLSGIFVNENRNGQWFRVRYNVNAAGVRTSVYSAERINNPLTVAALNTQSAASNNFFTRPLITVAGIAISPLRIAVAYGAYKFLKSRK